MFPTKNELPDLDNIEEYDGFILSGGHDSALDEVEWIPKFKVWLKKFCLLLKKIKKPIRVIGFCLGHHLIAETMGGKVEHGDFT